MLSALASLPQVREAVEPPATLSLFKRLADRETASPKIWMDAYLAAFAISGGFTLVTLDSDFSQYEAQGLSLQLLNR